MSFVDEKWSSFTLRIPIKADVETVYRAWATQVGLESWFLRLAEFTKQDGQVRHINDFVQKDDWYHWLWFGYDDGIFERKEVIEANGKDKLKFGFTGDCAVTVTISSEHDETICTLLQEHIPLDQNPKTNLALGCSVGWTFYLANLKSVLEGGIDLRNRNVLLKNVVNS
jgi:uncharacterized protein YndB with AHSA1/START domain